MSTLSKILETYSIIKTEVARLQMRWNLGSTSQD
jgi:hypothetical protein